MNPRCSIFDRPYYDEDTTETPMTATNLPASMTYNLPEAERMHDMEGGYLLVAGTDPVLYYVCDEASALDFGRTAEELAGLAPHYSEAKK